MPLVDCGTPCSSIWHSRDNLSEHCDQVVFACCSGIDQGRDLKLRRLRGIARTHNKLHAKNLGDTYDLTAIQAYSRVVRSTVKGRGRNLSCPLAVGSMLFPQALDRYGLSPASTQA